MANKEFCEDMENLLDRLEENIVRLSFHKRDSKALDELKSITQSLKNLLPDSPLKTINHVVSTLELVSTNLNYNKGNPRTENHPEMIQALKLTLQELRESYAAYILSV